MHTKVRALIGALVMSAGSLAFVATPAQALTARTVSIHVSPHAALKTTKVTFSGSLSKSPKGSPVKVQRKSATSWINVKTTATATAAGAWSVKVALPAAAGNYRFRSFAPAKPGLRAATSRPITVTALRRTTFYSIDGTNDFVLLADGPGTSKALGSLRPAFTAGAVARAQRKAGATWITVGTGTIHADGSFAIPIPTRTNGTYRVTVARKGLNAAATSRATSFVFPP